MVKNSTSKHLPTKRNILFGENSKDSVKKVT